jgi:cation diffusion facilitator family transporter
MKFGKTGRLLAMLSVTASFFLVELVVGYVTHSMALVADSFHMLSDVLALLVAFLSVRISKRTSTKNTFGWARAEVLGALVNSVFLMALCFSIFVEAIDRFHMQTRVENPILVLIVGCIGLAVNLFGLLIFHRTFDRLIA